jgi:DNA-binding response OmpR family regulator
VKILIADDNPVFQLVLKVMLTNWGYSVVVAGDGEEAWKILRADRGPRLAILDWIMPGMEGIEVCRLARAAFGRGVYILILTSKTQSQDLEAAFQAGADDYVTKPFNSQELRVRLAAAYRILDLEEQLALAWAQTPSEARYGQSPNKLGKTALINRYGKGTGLERA